MEGGVEVHLSLAAVTAVEHQTSAQIDTFDADMYLCHSQISAAFTNKQGSWITAYLNIPVGNQQDDSIYNGTVAGECVQPSYRSPLEAPDDVHFLG